MAKKNKIQRKSTKVVMAKPPVKAGAPPTPKLKATATLIVFDKRTKVFLVVLLAAYMLMSFFKLHTSSIGYWDKLFGEQESPAVIAGEPKLIRADEWRTSTPAAIGQYFAGMPVSNYAFGGGNVPLIWGLPVKDMSTALRPAMWPYFIFDVERAFAFSWNFNIFFFLISTFLLLMLLTRNNFWLSAFGSFFLFLSSGIQWWSYFIATYWLYMNTAVISFIYLLYSKKLYSLIIAGLMFLFGAYGYLFNLYPPFQLPLVYLSLFILLGFILREKNYEVIKGQLFLRVAAFCIVIVIFGLFAYHYYSLAKDTYRLMMNTVYPGHRVSTGGDLVSGKFFSEFFGLYMTDSKVPTQWMNISEESGFLMFFPILFYAIGYNYLRFKKIDALQLCLSIFLLISFFYILWGFPAFLSKLSLFSLSEARRVLPIAEAGNCILLVCFLSDNDIRAKFRFSWSEFVPLLIGVIVYFVLVGKNITTATGDFFASDQVAKVVVLFSIVYLMIRYKYFRFITPALCLLLIVINLSNITINPLTVGLSPILENPLIKVSKGMHDKDPQARWAVFGNSGWADLLKANGINALNGVKMVPPVNDLKVLDPRNQFDTVHNRFAHVGMLGYIDWKDSINFQWVYTDSYVMNMDPCSPRMEKLNVKYFVFTYPPKPAEVRCMTALDSTGLYLYERNER